MNEPIECYSAPSVEWRSAPSGGVTRTLEDIRRDLVRAGFYDWFVATLPDDTLRTADRLDDLNDLNDYLDPLCRFR